MDYKIEKERIYSNIEYAFNDMQIIKEKLGYYLEEEKQKWYCDLEDDERIYINNIAEKLEAYYKIAILENVENENNPKIIDIYIFIEEFKYWKRLTSKREVNLPSEKEKLDLEINMKNQKLELYKKIKERLRKNNDDNSEYKEIFGYIKEKINLEDYEIPGIITNEELLSLFEEVKKEINLEYLDSEYQNHRDIVKKVKKEVKETSNVEKSLEIVSEFLEKKFPEIHGYYNEMFKEKRICICTNNTMEKSLTIPLLKGYMYINGERLSRLPYDILHETIHGYDVKNLKKDRLEDKDEIVRKYNNENNQFLIELKAIFFEMLLYEYIQNKYLENSNEIVLEYWYKSKKVNLLDFAYTNLAILSEIIKIKVKDADEKILNKMGKVENGEKFNQKPNWIKTYISNPEYIDNIYIFGYLVTILKIFKINNNNDRDNDSNSNKNKEKFAKKILGARNIQEMYEKYEENLFNEICLNISEICEYLKKGGI